MLGAGQLCKPAYRFGGLGTAGNGSDQRRRLGPVFAPQPGRKLGVVEFGRSASMQAVKPRRRKALRFKPRGSSKYVFAKKTRPFKKALKGNPAFKNTAEDREYNAKVVKIFGKLYAGAIS